VLNIDISEVQIPAGECTRVAQLPMSAFNVLCGSSHRDSLDSWVTMVLDQSISFISHLGLGVVHDKIADKWQPMKPCSIHLVKEEDCNSCKIRFAGVNNSTKNWNLLTY